MSRLHTVCIFAFLVGLSLGFDRLAIERSVNPTKWTLQSKVEDDKPVKLIFAVKQQNVELLEKSLLQIANPKHPRYGKHLTRDEVNALVAPKVESIEIITSWIQEQIQAEDILEMEILSDWITLVIPASSAKDLIECTFHRYSHSQNSKITLARCVEGTYTVPSRVAPHLDFIGGTIHFPKLSYKTITPSKLGATPDSLRSLYNVGNTVGQAANNTQAVAQFLGQYYSPADLKEFFTLFFWPDITNAVERVVGDNYWYDPGVEASLDIEYIMAMGANIPTWFYSTAGEHENQEPFLEWALLVGNETDAEVPKVISVSYGDDEDSLDYSYADRVSNEFAKMGSRGISVLFASGDSGVGCNNAGNQFVPNFPASSPWVTAVGGTALSWDNSTEETNSLSGGGFSNYFGVPDYQVNAIKTYFQRAKDLPAASFYNASGRAYPDVSALSSGFTVVIDLLPMPGVAGTSCAAPTYSGIVSLLNDIRLQNSKPTLGFLNIWLYQLLEDNPSGFNDITSGCNPGCFANDGFCATVGWDPSSGVGSPNYVELAKIVRALP